MGAKIPPPRAVFEGTTGPSNNSAPQIEYPNPKEHLELLTKLFEVVPTDEYTSDVEEGLMDFGPPLPAHS